MVGRIDGTILPTTQAAGLGSEGCRGGDARLGPF